MSLICINVAVGLSRFNCHQIGDVPSIAESSTSRDGPDYLRFIKVDQEVEAVRLIPIHANIIFLAHVDEPFLVVLLTGARKCQKQQGKAEFW